jgi:site-specific DNA recombinase
VRNVPSFIGHNFDGSVNWQQISSQGSGEVLDRQELRDLEDLIQSGTIDVVVVEDLGRICRRIEAFSICELCEDFGVRLIAINDNIDTYTDGWRLNAFFASMRHEMYNADTAKRIRRSLRNRFQSGGVFQCPIFGYLKPEVARTDDAVKDEDVRKDPEAEPIYDGVFTKLENGASYAEVADWLNEQGIDPGPSCRSKKWNGPMLGRIVHNPILKGVRVRNDRMAKRVNRTGRRKSIKAPPEERLERECPHLALIDPERYDRVIRMLDERNACYRRKGENGRDTRADVPKKRTIWPGQHLFCGICGRMFVYGGHGKNDHLVCFGAKDYKCWQGITVDGPLASGKMTDAVLEAIKTLPDFDETLVNLVARELETFGSACKQELVLIERELVKIARIIENILSFLRDGHGSEAVAEDLKRQEHRKLQLERQRDAIRTRPKQIPELPPIEEIKSLARESMREQGDRPQEFGRLMRRLIPRIVVHPFRLCDGGHIVLRARFSLTLVSFVAQAEGIDAAEDSLTQDLEIDLFDPPQREKYRQVVVEQRAAGRKEREIADELGITQPAVQYAAALQRAMDRLGITDPYLPVNEPPEDYAKLRRHKHRRFNFEPLSDEVET